MAQLSTNLIVRGEAVQALFAQYRAGNLVVNRRYQRKLVWSVDEKESFIDSLMQQLPVPLILVAERKGEERARLEIIDGLQRLDAVFSFVNNQFAVHGGYFDLETLAETKEDFDARRLKQKRRVLPRDLCTRFAGYNLPLSVYRADSDAEVDEIFRRINSGGRHLSRQDLRQAGSTSNFADLVREVAASIRGDFSVSDIVDLRDMPEISISSTKDAPGVFVEDIPWVKQRVLNREEVRESRDEEVIADLLVSMLIEPTPAYDSRVLDAFYGLASDADGRNTRVEAVIQRDTPDAIKARFTRVLETLLGIFDGDGKQFATVLFDAPRQRVPRYFEAVFLGLDKLLSEENLELVDVAGAQKALDGAGNGHIDIPSGGGTWTARSKRTNTDVVAGLLRGFMQPASGVLDPILERNALEVENLLRAARVESSLIEFKQGLSRLSEPPRLDDEIIFDILRTVSGMANHGPGATGYVLIGVADTPEDAQRVEALGGGTGTLVEGRYVTGLKLDRDQHKSLDDLLLWFTTKAQASPLHHAVAAQVLRDLRAVAFMGHTVLLVRVKALDEPVPFGDSFYERLGSQTVEVQGGQVGRLFTRFR
ncbi:MAG: DUF262 domain-containing protein [Gaiellaceae bacterium]